jgi:hypothetical protein
MMNEVEVKVGANPLPGGVQACPKLSSFAKRNQAWRGGYGKDEVKVEVKNT